MPETNKIEEIVEGFRKNVGVLYDKHKGVEDELRQTLTHLRAETIKECEGAVGEDKVKSKLTTHEQTWYFIDGYNTAKQEIRERLTKLK